MSYFYCCGVRDRGDEALEPDLPEDQGFLALYYGSGFCIVEADEKLEAERLPEELSSLLDSCDRYPPALALAMEDMERRNPSREDAFDEFKHFLRGHLNAQPTAGHLLLRARGTQLGYCTEGAYYWVVGVRDRAHRLDRDEVRWVSYDYQIYGDGASVFGVDVEQMRRHFRGLDA